MRPDPIRTNRWLPDHSLTALVILLLAISIASLLLWRVQPLVAEENEFLEHAQVSLLALAFLLHGRQAWRFRTSDLAFLIHAGLAVLAYAFVVREFDFDQIGSAPIWTLLDKGTRLLRVIALLAVFALIGYRFRQVFRNRGTLLALPVMRLCIAAAIFLVLGGLFDRRVFASLPLDTSRFVEEVLELNGYVLFLAASLSDAARDWGSAATGQARTMPELP